MARTGLSLLIGLIFFGWICLWFLKPTEIWTKKWHNAEDNIGKTIFRYNGLNFLVFTFPVVAVCMLGQVHMHLQSRDSKSRKWGKASTALSSPFLIKTPLGLISAFEIIPISIFISLLAWTFYSRISRDFMKLTPDKPLKLDIWQLKFLSVAKRSGLLAEICLSVLLLPVLRGLSLFRVLGVQFEASVRYHIWVGTSMLLFATLHGFGTLFIWGTNRHIQDQIWKWQKEGRIYLAGGITLVTGLIIWMTSLPPVRRKSFELFYCIHHLYLVFLVFFLFHAGDRHFYMVFPGVVLFGLDKLLRIVQSQTETCILSARIFPCKAIELTLPKDPSLEYRPTSIVFMKIPTISRFQWHPFSITSSSTTDEHTMSVMVKCEGWWTNSVYNTIQKELHLGQEQNRCIPVYIEGPYGPTVVDFLRCDSLIMVAGGIGIAPFLSILQDIASSKGHGTGQFPSNIHFLYVAKKSQSLSLLRSVSNLILNQSTDGSLHLKLKVFLTQEEKLDADLKELLSDFSGEQRVLLATSRSNHKVRGPENPFHMAAVVGLCSFVFILCLCFFNHFFLPPGSKPSKKEKKTPSTLVDLLLLSSFFIALAWCALISTLLKWRRLKKEIWSNNKKERSCVQLKFEEPMTSMEQHEIHLMGRPNFPEELCRSADELGSSDVGVVVCGPQSMRDSVALACRQSCKSPVTNVGKRSDARFTFYSLNFTL